jgi:hypothetical protein
MTPSAELAETIAAGHEPTAKVVAGVLDAAGKNANDLRDDASQAASEQATSELENAQAAAVEWFLLGLVELPPSNAAHPSRLGPVLGRFSQRGRRRGGLGEFWDKTVRRMPRPLKTDSAAVTLQPSGALRFREPHG